MIVFGKDFSSSADLNLKYLVILKPADQNPLMI